MPEEVIREFPPQEMLSYLSYIQKYATAKPRTYWVEVPFYAVINGARQRFNFGNRPDDLAHIDTIEQKVWKKHEAHLSRLERFPLEKAKYYLRLKKSHGVDTIRGLAQITGEDWSYIARVLKVLNLPDQVKDYLMSNKDKGSFPYELGYI